MTCSTPTSIDSARRAACGRVAALAATVAAALVALVAAPGSASAATTTTTTIAVPARPAIRAVTLHFAGRPTAAPTISAQRSAVTGSPTDVTFVTGVKKNRSTGRWVGLLTMIRFKTPQAPAAGATDRVRVRSNVAFTVGINTLVTGAGDQAARIFAGGGYTPRVGRLAQGAYGDDWGRGGGADILREVGSELIYVGAPERYYRAIGRAPRDWFLVEVKPTGDGTGAISDNYHRIYCAMIEGAIQSPFWCREWYEADKGLRPVMSFGAGANSVFEGWHPPRYACNLPEPHDCDLGTLAGGQVVTIGGMFFKTS